MKLPLKSNMASVFFWLMPFFLLAAYIVSYIVYSAWVSYRYDSDMAVVELLSALLLAIATGAAFILAKKIINCIHEAGALDLDALVKLGAFTGAALYFVYQVFAGYFANGISVQLRCERHEAARLDTVVARISKASGTYTKIVALNANHVPLPVDTSRLTAESPGWVSFPGIDRIPWSAEDKHGQAADVHARTGRLRLNPNDSLEFSHAFPVTEKAPHYIQVVLYAKGPFNINEEQWNASCIVAGK